MADVLYKRGSKQRLEQIPLEDGALIVTTDDGKIHVDYKNENDEVVRKTLYSGKLTFGDYVYDGTEDVNVEVYTGQIN